MTLSKLAGDLQEKRLQPVVEHWIHEEQCGFCPLLPAGDSQEVCPSGLHVLSGSDEGLLPGPSGGGSVGDAAGLWGSRSVVMGCSVPV